MATAGIAIGLALTFAPVYAEDGDISPVQKKAQMMEKVGKMGILGVLKDNLGEKSGLDQLINRKTDLVAFNSLPAKSIEAQGEPMKPRWLKVPQEGDAQAAGIDDIATENGHRPPTVTFYRAAAIDEKNIELVGKARGLKNIFERLLKTNPKLAGKVLVKFVIDQDGKVADTTIVTSTMGHQLFERCLIDRIGNWRFAPSTTNQKTAVELPLEFNAGV